MSVKQRTNAETLGKRYAELVRERGIPVQGLWVRQVVGVPELWIVTDVPDLRSMESVVSPLTDLQSEYPATLFEDHVLNSSWIPDFHKGAQIPPDAKRIELRG